MSQIRRKLVMVGDGACGKVGWNFIVLDHEVLESYADILGAFVSHWCGTAGMHIVHTRNVIY